MHRLAQDLFVRSLAIFLSETFRSPFYNYPFILAFYHRTPPRLRHPRQLCPRALDYDSVNFLYFGHPLPSPSSRQYSHSLSLSLSRTTRQRRRIVVPLFSFARSRSRPSYRAVAHLSGSHPLCLYRFATFRASRTSRQDPRLMPAQVHTPRRRFPWDRGPAFTLRPLFRTHTQAALA